MNKKPRIVIPRKPLEMLNLTGLVLDKHLADGATSKLNGLDMTDMEAKRDFAQAQHDLAVQHALNRENATQQRNLALGIQVGQVSFEPGTVRFYLRSIRDILLGHFRGEEKKLGLWGYDVNINAKGNVSVGIPTSILKLFEMSKKINDKHVADGIDSLLTEVDMTDFVAKRDLAETEHKLAHEENRLKENAVQQRNRTLGLLTGQRRNTKGTLIHYLSSARDVLLGHFRGEEQQLGLWGFEVNTSTPPSDPAASATGVVMDSVSLMPVGGVTIDFVTSAGPVQAVTNPQGVYTVELDIPEMELVNVNITHPGYQPFNDTQAITPGEEHEIDFSITPEA